ncbi:MAG: hypothetical protein ABSG12_11340 [Steroidobacteraceae bacterium]|jgi:hypothetical protein
MWVADIVRSQEIQSEGLLDEFNALYNVLEAAESHQSRVRGLFLA